MSLSLEGFHSHFFHKRVSERRYVHQIAVPKLWRNRRNTRRLGHDVLFLHAWPRFHAKINGDVASNMVVQSLNSVAHKWRHDSDKTQTNKLEWWMILKISSRAKGGVPKTLLEQKHRLNFLYFPQNTLMLTESREEFSDLHSIFRLRALRYSPFFPPHIGAEPGRAKEESRITCMCMLRTQPLPPPPPQKKKKNRGKNHIWKYFPDLACGAIFWMIIYKQQFLHSWLKIPVPH